MMSDFGSYYLNLVSVTFIQSLHLFLLSKKEFFKILVLYTGP